MFVIAWRHSPRTAWEFIKDPVSTEQDARAKINQLGKYDMVGREYRIAHVGDADTWIDPVAEQAARLGVADKLDPPTHRLDCAECDTGWRRRWECVECGTWWPRGQNACACGSTSQRMKDI